MKKRKFFFIMILLAGLAIFASIFSLSYQSELPGFASRNPAARQEIRKEKFTILPIILIGGIRFFQKAVEKK